MLEIGDNIVDVLDADGKPDIAIGDAGSQLVLDRKLRVGGRCRMDRQTAGIADIGDMVEELQRVDQFPPRLPAAGQFEADQAAKLAL